MCSSCSARRTSRCSPPSTSCTVLIHIICNRMAHNSCSVPPLTSVTRSVSVLALLCWIFADVCFDNIYFIHAHTSSRARVLTYTHKHTLCSLSSRSLWLGIERLAVSMTPAADVVTRELHVFTKHSILSIDVLIVSLLSSFISGLMKGDHGG